MEKHPIPYADGRLATGSKTPLLLILPSPLLFLLVQLPDIPVVLVNGSVGREEPGLCNVHQHHLLPLFPVLVVRKHLILHRDIVLQIQKGHKPVLVQKLLVKALQVLLVPYGQSLIADNEVNCLLDDGALFIVIF